MGNNEVLFSRLIGFFIGLVVCQCLAGLSARVSFGLFETKLDYVRRKGPFAFAGLLTGVIYFFLCVFITKLIFILIPNSLSMSEFAVWFNYASWAVLLVILAGKQRATPVIAISVIIGYFVTDVAYLMLTH